MIWGYPYFRKPPYIQLVFMGSYANKRVSGHQMLRLDIEEAMSMSTTLGKVKCQTGKASIFLPKKTVM